MISKDFIWSTKYRPETVDECILPDRLKVPFKNCVERKEIPSFLLSGSRGVGKTSIATAMCKEIGLDYMIINGSDESGIDTFRTKIKEYASSVSLTGGRKVIIVDEADYLNPQSIQPALRNAIETFASNCTFIFTCNYKNRLLPELISRFEEVHFQLKESERVAMAGKFFKRVLNILDSECVKYEESVVAEIVKKYFPDFRKTLNQLQYLSRFGEIGLGALTQLGDYKIDELLKMLREKDFKNMRKWVASNDIDATIFFRQIYDGLVTSMKPDSIPQAVIIIADYQYKHAFVADYEINIVACLTELMASCEFV